MATKSELAQAVALLRAEHDDMPVFDAIRLDMWWTALQNFPDGAILRAAQRHLTTNKFKPKLADIVEGCAAQLDANWLGADEAWAMVPKTEHDSAMLTQEIAEALGAAQPLMARQDWTAARMAFRDAYSRLVERAKIEGRMPAYYASLGTDHERKATMLAEAVRSGKATIEYVEQVAPEHTADVVRMVGVKGHPLLAGPSREGKAKLAQALTMLRLNHE